jgi:uncharacterized repeat protein (TIGR03803 family)
VLHSFDGGVGGGGIYAAPTVSGSVLYGVGQTGGANSLGVVYSMGTNGSGYQVLHTFTSASTDGSNPNGALTISGTQLFGVANHGGASSFGAIYTMNTDGTGFSLLHSFAGGPGDGSSPGGGLTLSGSTLYGATSTGGAAGSGNFGYGTVYKLNTDGTGYSVLHSFDTSGESPSALTLSGSKLYGTTNNAVSSGGTIFSMNTDGTGYTTLHTFALATDGQGPQALTLVGTTLYGLALNDGSSTDGTIFGINTDGTGFHILHSFTGGTTDGQSPSGELSFANGRLYGITNAGGIANKGTLFSINLDGSGYSLDYSLKGSPDGGNGADVSLSADGSMLYGATIGGGTSGAGTVISMALPTPEPGTLGLGLCGVVVLGWRRRRVAPRR